MKTKLTLFTIAFSLLALTMVSGVTEAEIDTTYDQDLVTTYEPVYEPHHDSETTLANWDSEDAENNDDGDEPEDDEWDDEDAENNEDAESEEDWDDEDAENEEEGESQDEEIEDEETEEDAENGDDGWDHEDSENTDDGDEPEDDEWDDEDAENTDDGWDHEDAENNDDGDGQDEEIEDEETEEETGQTRTRSYLYPQASPDYEMDLELDPETVYAGQSFTLVGNITGEDISENEEATIYINGEEVESTTISEDGNFEADLTIEDPGEHTLTVEALGEETESSINILSENPLQELDAPAVVSPGQQFEVCTEIQDEEEYDLTFTRNGETLETSSDTGESCFETTAPDSGTHTYAITLENDEEITEEVEVEVRNTTTSGGENEPDEGGLITGNFLYQGISNFIGSIFSMITGLFSAIV